MAEQMTVEEAFEALGIAPNSTEIEATKAFRQLSKQFHPDGSASDQGKQIRLNLARDVLTGYYGGRQLVPVEVKRALQTIERDVASRQASAQAADFASATKRHRQRPIQQLKYSSLVTAGFAGAIGWFGGDLFGALSPLAVDGPGSLIIKRVALSFGALSAILQFLVQHQNHLVESFSDQLDDEEFCLEQLKRFRSLIAEGGRRFAHIYTDLERRPFYGEDRLSLDAFDFTQSFTVQELVKCLHISRRVLMPRFIDLIYRWYFRWLKLDLEQRTRLVVLKAVEHAILEPVTNSKKQYRATAEYAGQLKAHALIRL